MSELLKLMALDDEDLAVVSAHIQDGVLKTSEMDYVASTGQLLIPFNRFAWEAKSARRWVFKSYERRRSLLRITRINELKTRDIDREDSQQILSILSITFANHEELDDPAGEVQINFAGGAAINANVECLEVQLTDTGGAWSTTLRPYHNT